MFLNKGNFKTNTHQITIYHARGGGMKMYKIKEIYHLEKGKQIDTTLLSPANPYKYINGEPKNLVSTPHKIRKEKLYLYQRGGASCGCVTYINENFWCGYYCYKLIQCKFSPKYIYYALKENQTELIY